VLEHLLKALERGGVQTTASLARELQATPALVEMMLADLERRGFVAQVGTCGEACGGCSLAEGCADGRTRLWAVREGSTVPCLHAQLAERPQ